MNWALELRKSAEDLKEELVAIRREIHQNPEPAFEEFGTSERIREYLADLDLEVSSVAKTGVAAVLQGKAAGKTLLLRADMDCLRIPEKTDIAFASKAEGLMHACGHDAHVAWLLGAAKLLSKYREQLFGNVKFVFQPAEESPNGGAADVIHDGILENPKVDAVIGAHVEVSPAFHTGTIGVRYGAMNAAADFFTIRIIGKSGHIAKPHECIDPISTAVQVYGSLQHMLTKKIDPLEAVLIHIGSIHGGSANNAIPESLIMEGTVRTFREDIHKEMPVLMERVIRDVCSANGARYEFHMTEACPPLINDDRITSYVEAQAKEYYGEEHVIKMEKPDMFAEDHAYYQQERPGTYINIGSYNGLLGATEPLHSERFMIDEDILPMTAGFLAFCAIGYLDGR